MRGTGDKKRGYMIPESRSTPFPFLLARDWEDSRSNGSWSPTPHSSGVSPNTASSGDHSRGPDSSSESEAQAWPVYRYVSARQGEKRLTAYKLLP